MEIKQPCVVALTWTLKDTLGEELDVLDEAVEFLVGGADLLDVIEAALLGQQAGGKVELQIEPEQGFGDFNEQLVLLEPRKLFPAEIEEGMIFEGNALPVGCNPDAKQDAIYVVTDIYPEHIVLDGNHPLSGIALRLNLTIESVREATPEEVKAGSAGTGFFKIQALPEGTSGDRTLH